MTLAGGACRGCRWARRRAAAAAGRRARARWRCAASRRRTARRAGAERGGRCRARSRRAVRPSPSRSRLAVEQQRAARRSRRRSASGAGGRTGRRSRSRWRRSRGALADRHAWRGRVRRADRAGVGPIEPAGEVQQRRLAGAASGPTRATDSPASTSRSTPSRATTSWLPCRVALRHAAQLEQRHPSTPRGDSGRSGRRYGLSPPRVEWVPTRPPHRRLGLDGGVDVGVTAASSAGARAAPPVRTAGSRRRSAAGRRGAPQPGRAPRLRGPRR